jgi:hypothetical protein
MIQNNTIPADIPELEQTVISKAGELDSLRQQTFETAAPSGVYSSKALTRIVKEVNKLLPLFDEEPVAELTEDVDGPMPVELVRVLSMINAAASDAGMEEHTFELADVVSDDELSLVTGKVNALSKSGEFKSFLRSPQKEELVADTTEQEEVSPEDNEAETDIKEEDVDNLFMQRM